MDLWSSLVVWAFSGSHLTRLLYGVLTYVPLVGIDYKVIGTGRITLVLVLLGWVESQWSILCF